MGMGPTNAQINPEAGFLPSCVVLESPRSCHETSPPSVTGPAVARGLASSGGDTLGDLPAGVTPRVSTNPRSSQPSLSRIPRSTTPLSQSPLSSPSPSPSLVSTNPRSSQPSSARKPRSPPSHSRSPPFTGPSRGPAPAPAGPRPSGDSNIAQRHNTPSFDNHVRGCISEVPHDDQTVKPPPPRPGSHTAPAGPPALGQSVTTAEQGGLLPRRFPIQPRSGPQIPVEFQVDGHTIRRSFVDHLDPSAEIFVPRSECPATEFGAPFPVDIVEEIVAAVSSDVVRDLSPAAPPAPCRCHQMPLGSCPTFIADFIDIVVRVRSHPSGRCNMDGARVPLRHRPIDPGPWEKMLVGYFDRAELVLGLTYGWDLSFLDNPSPRDAPVNHPSAYEHAEAIDEYIAVELAHGSLVGPLPADTPFPLFRSPLATVPKPPDKWRTITDCSQRGAGINAWIPANIHRGKDATITLPGTTEICIAIKKVQAQYPGEVVVLFKGDFGRYYRQFCVCPSQSPFLAVGWREEKYADRSWSFGNRGACGGAQRFSSAVSWFYRTKVPPRPGAVNSGINCACPGPCRCGCNQMEPYVDDSIGVAPQLYATFLFNTFIELVERLGLQLSATPGHITPPSTSVVALGLLYDTARNTVSLPPDKLAAITETLAEWKRKTHASPKELASFAGRLLWICNVVPPGRVFLGRVLATKRHADSLGHKVALDEDFKLDVEWWHDMVSPWNGRSFLVPVHSADISLDASSDAWLDGGPGIGGYNFVTHQFFATGVPPHMSSWYIGNLELFAYVIALSLWGDQWRGHTVSCLTDNEGVRFLLQNGRTRPITTVI